MVVRHRTSVVRPVSTSIFFARRDCLFGSFLASSMMSGRFANGLPTVADGAPALVEPRNERNVPRADVPNVGRLAATGLSRVNGVTGARQKLPRMPRPFQPAHGPTTMPGKRRYRQRCSARCIGDLPLSDSMQSRSSITPCAARPTSPSDHKTHPQRHGWATPAASTATRRKARPTGASEPSEQT
jgi:hypothetical protein